MFPGWNFPGSNFYNILRFEVELKIQDLLKLMIFQGLYGILERYFKDLCCLFIVMIKLKILKHFLDLVPMCIEIRNF